MSTDDLMGEEYQKLLEAALTMRFLGSVKG